MNDPKEHLFATASMAFVEPEVNQRDQLDHEAIDTYHGLSEKLRRPVEEIEKILNDYYEQNKYFPKKKASLIKWNVLRQRQSSLVEVFFGGPLEEGISAGATSGTGPLPNPPPPPYQPVPQVLTYVMIGAPPTGPTDPRHPGSS